MKRYLPLVVPAIWALIFAGDVAGWVTPSRPMLGVACVYIVLAAVEKWAAERLIEAQRESIAALKRASHIWRRLAGSTPT